MAHSAPPRGLLRKDGKLHTLRERLHSGYALTPDEMAWLQKAADDSALPPKHVRAFRDKHHDAPMDADAKLERLRDELRLLLAEYPELNWRPLGIAELTAAASGGAAAPPRRDDGDADEIAGGKVLKPAWRAPRQRAAGEWRRPGTRPVGFHLCERSSPASTMAARYPAPGARQSVGPGPGAYYPP